MIVIAFGRWACRWWRGWRDERIRFRGRWTPLCRRSKAPEQPFGRTRSTELEMSQTRADGLRIARNQPLRRPGPDE